MTASRRDPPAALHVAAYDIPDGRRRRRVYEALVAFGIPVQYSVVECRVMTSALARLRAALKPLVRPPQDSGRLYRICAACAPRAESLAGDPARVLGTEVV